MTTKPDAPTMCPDIVILGAGGRLGRTLTAAAVLRGRSVRAVVHHHNPFAESPSLAVSRADVHDPPTVISAIGTAGTVIVCLGSAGAPIADIATRAARTLTTYLATAAQAGRRLVSVTGTGAMLPGETLSRAHQIKRRQMQVGAPHLLRDGELHLAVVAASPLNWTVLRVPLMTFVASDFHRYWLSSAAPPADETATYQAAAVALLDLAGDNENWNRQAPFLRSAVDPLT